MGKAKIIHCLLIMNLQKATQDSSNISFKQWFYQHILQLRSVFKLVCLQPWIKGITWFKISPHRYKTVQYAVNYIYELEQSFHFCHIISSYLQNIHRIRRKLENVPCLHIIQGNNYWQKNDVTPRWKRIFLWGRQYIIDQKVVYCYFVLESEFNNSVPNTKRWN